MHVFKVVTFHSEWLKQSRNVFCTPSELLGLQAPVVASTPSSEVLRWQSAVSACESDPGKSGWFFVPSEHMWF